MNVDVRRVLDVVRCEFDVTTHEFSSEFMDIYNSLVNLSDEELDRLYELSND